MSISRLPRETVVKVVAVGLTNLRVIRDCHDAESDAELAETLVRYGLDVADLDDTELCVRQMLFVWGHPLD